MPGLFGLFKRQVSIPCYHCGERVALCNAVRFNFNGEQRLLCCHGCEAVLIMIESNGFSNEYLQNKANDRPSPV